MWLDWLQNLPNFDATTIVIIINIFDNHCFLRLQLRSYLGYDPEPSFFFFLFPGLIIVIIVIYLLLQLNWSGCFYDYWNSMNGFLNLIPGLFFDPFLFAKGNVDHLEFCNEIGIDLLSQSMW